MTVVIDKASKCPFLRELISGGIEAKPSPKEHNFTTLIDALAFGGFDDDSVRRLLSKWGRDFEDYKGTVENYRKAEAINNKPNFPCIRIQKYHPQSKKICEKCNSRFGKAMAEFTDTAEMGKRFCEVQPVYYDRAKNWWLWNFVKNCWELVDETDLMIKIDDKLHKAGTIQSSYKNMILESLRRAGRRNTPKDMPKTWIQFKDEIIDVTTAETITPTAEYFTTNPIPWEIGDSEDTPTMDRIFKEWVGEECVKTLYEIIAYCLLSDYPLHRIFCLVGGGLNGKTKFLQLITKFIGKDNCCSTELDLLLTSRFEASKVYKKLACMMGETNFTTLKKTSLLKKLCGQDVIGYEWKNKNLIDDYNYAKIIISTNSLPVTLDKTVGFYRRWLLIDFPNVFSEKKDILAEIPNKEYNNLAKKSIRILKELLDRREFTNEGSIEERKQRYEDRSNYLMKFVKEECVKEVNATVKFSTFYEGFIEFCRLNDRRFLSNNLVSRILKEYGFEIATKKNKSDDTVSTARYIQGLRLKQEEENNREAEEEQEEGFDFE